MKLSKDEKIICFSYYAIKAFIQSLQSKSLNLYEASFELFNFYLQFWDYLWRTNIQIYGEVKAGVYWYKTLVHWLLENISDL